MKRLFFVFISAFLLFSACTDIAEAPESENTVSTVSTDIASGVNETESDAVYLKVGFDSDSSSRTAMTERITAPANQWWVTGSLRTSLEMQPFRSKLELIILLLLRFTTRLSLKKQSSTQSKKVLIHFRLLQSLHLFLWNSGARVM